MSVIGQTRRTNQQTVRVCRWAISPDNVRTRTDDAARHTKLTQASKLTRSEVKKKIDNILHFILLYVHSSNYYAFRFNCPAIFLATDHGDGDRTAPDTGDYLLVTACRQLSPCGQRTSVSDRLCPVSGQSPADTVLSCGRAFSRNLISRFFHS